jgi:uncharacterized protein YbjT (DUF2867 family)
MARTILLTGATGTVGSEVLRLLTGREGIQVRAAVRDLHKGARLAAPNIDPVWFDYNKPESLSPACRGADSIFLVAPLTPDGVPEALALLLAAQETGVKHVVKLSVTHSVRDTTVGQWHAAIDDPLKKSSLAWTILRPGGFMQNFVEGSAPQPDGGIYLPVGSAKAAFIDTRDLAAVAVKALTESGHVGKEYELSGPEALAYSEAAGIMSEVSGREIHFMDVPESAARRAMLDQRMPGWMVGLILELCAWNKAGLAGEINTTVADILGRSAHTFREFARDYADQWKV